MSNGNPFTQVAREAANTTNARLDEQLSSLSRLTDGQLRSLFPSKADKQRLAELMAIVAEATAENEKVVQLKRNIDQLAGTVVRLVGALR